MPNSPTPAILYLVGTPIGNLEDITFRAVRILQTVDLIAAEDTRHTGKLLQHFEIATPQVSYHEHNRQQRTEALLTRLSEGEAIALVTDAGMPGISDPGYELVKACVETGVQVVPIPGVTAATTALAAGLPSSRFVFEGFLPTKNKDRQTRFDALKSETRTLILYESPHRLRQTLKDLAAVLGEYRQIVLARELTKLHEVFWRGKIGDAITHYTREEEPKGEFTLVIAGAEQTETLNLSETELKAELQQLLEQGMTRSQASRQLAQFSSLSRRQIYQLTIKEEG
ncbi:MAG: 16S rRNA (cytidine(1402)-2'-O)-methyltransferase [Cyanobacteria bacterium SW_12_48_29]|nr:MAG: 16S rRNA (cytidine(1402)-2'-O)-methyltransferase [Cyanobacteria bacterium SW_12_48_29]